MENSKKKKKMTKKMKQMRSVIIMMLICALMMSSATYAWFTLSSTAKVSNITMTVGESEGFVIAPAATKTTAGTYGSVLEFNNDEVKDGSQQDVAAVNPYQVSGKLLPALYNASGVQSPVYDANGKVSSFSVVPTTKYLTSDTDTGVQEDGYCYTTSFYLKSTSPNDVNVMFATGTSIVDDSSAEVDGSPAIRIALEDGAGNRIVYAAERPDSVPGNLTYAERTVENTADESYAATVTDDDFAAQTDAIVATAEGTKVTMYIWLDGDDELCVNEIMLQEILANIVLGTEDDVTTP